MKLWHPHTEQPTRCASVLIALVPAEDDAPEDQRHWLAKDLYDFHPGKGFINAESGEELRYSETRFFWAYESDVLHELDAQLQEITS